MTATRENKDESANPTVIKLSQIPYIKGEGLLGWIAGKAYEYYHSSAIEQTNSIIQAASVADKTDFGVSHLWIGPAHCFMITNPYMMEDFFSFKKQISRSEAVKYNFAQGIGPMTVFTAPHRDQNGLPNPIWQKQRKIMMNAIHKSKLAIEIPEKMTKIVNDILTNELDAKLKEQKEFSTDLESLCIKLTMLVMAKLLMGIPLDDKEFATKTDKLADLYTELLKESLKLKNEVLAAKGKQTPANSARKNLNDFVTTHYTNKYKANILETDNVIRQIAAMDPANENKHFEDFTLDTDFIKDAINFTLLVGHDTTSRAIQFMLMYLANSPKLLNTISAEIKDHIPNDGIWSPEIISELPTLNAVFKEVERLHPGVPLLVYKVLEDIDLVDNKPRTLKLKKDNVVFFSIWNMHRSHKFQLADSKITTPIDQFDHNRFLEKEYSLDPHTKQTAFKPFGAGERSCIAYNNFAPLEAMSAVIEIVQRYHISIDDEPPFNCDKLGSIRSSTKVNITVSPVKEPRKEYGVKSPYVP